MSICWAQIRAIRKIRNIKLKNDDATKRQIARIGAFFGCAFLLTFALNKLPEMSAYGVEIKDILCGLGPLTAALLCYKILRIPNHYQISLWGVRPLLILAIVGAAVAFPLAHGVLAKHPKPALAAFVLTQIVYCFGEEFGWRHYLQNVTAGLNKWLTAFTIGTAWFFWHYSFISDPIFVLTGQKIPYYVGVPICILFLSLLSMMFGDLVIKTKSILVPTVGHAATKYGDPLSMGVVFLLLIALELFWNRLKPVQAVPPNGA